MNQLRRRVEVFASMRFGDDHVHKHEAPALREKLAPHNIDLIIAAPNTGEYITTHVFLSKTSWTLQDEDSGEMTSRQAVAAARLSRSDIIPQSPTP